MQWPTANSHPVLNSPFNPSTWRASLHDFSDLSFTDDLIYDIEYGGHIGYTGPRTSGILPNHLSAIWNITSTALELERELGLGRKIGPFLTPSVDRQMDAIPKKRLKPVKWCIIHDLSWPAGHSINDSIPKDNLLYFPAPTTPSIPLLLLLSYLHRQIFNILFCPQNFSTVSSDDVICISGVLSLIYLCI